MSISDQIVSKSFVLESGTIWYLRKQEADRRKSRKMQNIDVNVERTLPHTNQNLSSYRSKPEISKCITKFFEKVACHYVNPATWLCARNENNQSMADTMKQCMWHSNAFNFFYAFFSLISEQSLSYQISIWIECAWKSFSIQTLLDPYDLCVNAIDNIDILVYVC